MTDREKLIKLLCVAHSKSTEAACFEDATYAKQLRMEADHLIANGVTIQKWIPFDEIKPKNGQSVLGITTEGEMEVYEFDEKWKTCLCQCGGNVKTFNITHWMPLPEPPKGD